MDETSTRPTANYASDNFSDWLWQNSTLKKIGFKKYITDSEVINVLII